MAILRILAVVGLVCGAGCDSLVGADCPDTPSGCYSDFVGDARESADGRGSVDADVGADARSWPDGSWPVDAAMADAGPWDASTNDAIFGDGAIGDAAPADGAIDCGGQTWCGAGCVDTSADPDNCGLCGNVCSSGLCSASVCVGGGGGGRVVLIGHDYRESRAGMSRLVGNAVFLANGVPVRVAAYDEYAAAAAVSGTDAAIDQVAAEQGRSWERVGVSTPGLLVAALADVDVVVIYSQANASDAQLLDLGVSTQVALNSFVASGGVIVVLDGTGGNNGTFQAGVHAGLIQVASRSAVAAGPLTVVAPGDAVAIGVPSSYAVETSTVSFATAMANVVVVHGSDPVVVHNVF